MSDNTKTTVFVVGGYYDDFSDVGFSMDSIWFTLDAAKLQAKRLAATRLENLKRNNAAGFCRMGVCPPEVEDPITVTLLAERGYMFDHPGTGIGIEEWEVS